MERVLRAFAKGRRGSFLVETMVALSLVLVGILGMVVLLTRSLQLTANVTQRAVAAYLAAEGIEVMKHLIDVDIAKGEGWTPGDLPSSFEVQYNSAAPIALSGNARPLRLDAVGGLYSYDEGSSPTPFRRAIAVTMVGDDEVRINSVVTSTLRGTNETINLEDHFFNWRKR
jgi:hypothetical protein